MRFAAILFLGVSASCVDLPSDTKGISTVSRQSDRPSGVSEEVWRSTRFLDQIEIRQMVLEATSRTVRWGSDLVTAQRVVERLCQEQNKLHASCPLYSLIREGGQVRTCSAGERPAAAQLVVRLPESIDYEFQFTINDTWTSSAFSGGESSLRFFQAGNDGEDPPRFSQIFKIVLEPGPNEERPLPGISALEPFQIALGNQKISSRIREAAGALAGVEHVVDLGKLSELRSQPACRITLDEINEWRVDESSRTESAAESVRRRTEQEISNLDVTSLLRTLTRLEKEATESLQSVDIQEELVFKITSEILALSDSGCRLRKPLKSLEVEITGERIPRKLVQSDAKTKMLAPVGRSEMASFLEVSMGPVRVQYNLNNESPLGIRTQVDISGYPGLTVGQLNTLRIRKPGVSYENVDISEKRLVSFLDRTRYDIFELGALTVQKVRYWANGDIVYARSFRDGQLVSGHNPRTDQVLDEDVSSQSDFVRLSAQSCSAN